jgi:hypothetical protein
MGSFLDESQDDVGATVAATSAARGAGAGREVASIVPGTPSGGTRPHFPLRDGSIPVRLRAAGRYRPKGRPKVALHESQSRRADHHRLRRSLVQGNGCARGRPRYRAWDRAAQDGERLDEPVEEPSDDGSDRRTRRTARWFGAAPRRVLLGPRGAVFERGRGRFSRIRVCGSDDADSHGALAFVAYPRLTQVRRHAHSVTGCSGDVPLVSVITLRRLAVPSALPAPTTPSRNVGAPRGRAPRLGRRAA